MPALLEGGADLDGCLLSRGRGLGEVQDFDPCSGKPEEVQNFKNSRLLDMAKAMALANNNQLENKKDESLGDLHQQGQRRWSMTWRRPWK